MRVLRLAVKSLLVLAVIVGAVAVAVSLWAPQKRRAADRGWAESFEPMEALVARYPGASTSPAAQELAVLSARVGISLETPPVEGTPRDREQAARAGLRLGKEETKRLLPLVSFLTAEGAKADDETIEAPPPPVAEFLSRHRADIEAIEARVLAKDAIAWACDLRKAPDGPTPPLLGHRHLASVLLVHALDAARAGDDAAAQRALESSWKLDIVLQERPELISQLVSMAIAWSHNAVLRRIAGTPEEWSERLSTRGWRLSMLRSIQAEAWMFGRFGAQVGSRAGDAGRGSGLAGPTAHLPGPLARSWLELSIADYSDHIRRMSLELKGQDPCALDIAAFTRRTEAEIPWWNILSKIAMPALARSWGSIGRTLLDDELTALVVRGRAQAPAPPLSIPSSACAGLSWTSRSQANGDLEIEADRNPFKDPRSAPPLSFRVHRRHGAPSAPARARSTAQAR